MVALLSAMQFIALPPDPVKAALPVEYRSVALGPSAGSTTHTVTGTAKILEGGADDFQLEVVIVAYQIHPATVEELDALGPVGGHQLSRWTMEGPTLLMPGDTANCSLKVLVSHSQTDDPGTDWKEYRPGPYRFRSYRTRIQVDRPNEDYSFRIYRLASRATRLERPAKDYLLDAVFRDG